MHSNGDKRSSSLHTIPCSCPPNSRVTVMSYQDRAPLTPMLKLHVFPTSFQLRGYFSLQIETVWEIFFCIFCICTSGSRGQTDPAMATALHQSTPGRRSVSANRGGGSCGNYSCNIYCGSGEIEWHGSTIYSNILHQSRGFIVVSLYTETCWA